MPRRSRIIVPGTPLHIIQRGNNRQACFFADEDYLFYLDWLEEYSKSSRCSIHAYVLMTNHVHILVTPKNADSAGKLMKMPGQRYVQYINRTYKRSGTLWQDRFRSNSRDNRVSKDNRLIVSSFNKIWSRMRLIRYAKPPMAIFPLETNDLIMKSAKCLDVL